MALIRYKSYMDCFQITTRTQLATYSALGVGENYPGVPAFTNLCSWHEGVGFVEDILSRPVFYVGTTIIGGTHFVAEFLGTKYSSVAATCGNTSPYVQHVWDTVASAGVRLCLDVVKAWEDGAWTSSTQIKIYWKDTTATTRAFVGRWGNTTSVTSKNSATSTAGVNCSTNLVATFTITDDGVISVA